MHPPLSHLLGSMVPALILALVGRVIRQRDPRGWVHGLVDWNKVSPAQRVRTGHVVGNLLVLMGLLVLGHGLYLYRHPGDPLATRHAALVLGAALGVLVAGLIGYLLRLPQDGTAQPPTPPHAR